MRAPHAIPSWVSHEGLSYTTLKVALNEVARFRLGVFRVWGLGV